MSMAKADTVNKSAGFTNLGVLNEVFKYSDQLIRVEIDENQEPWFAVSDVCAALKHSNSRKAIRDLVDCDDVTTGYTIDAIGRKQKVNLINFTGVICLCMGSRVKGAREFRRWISREVIPQIRERGMYLTKEKEKQLKDLESVVKALESEVMALHKSKGKSPKKRDPMLKVTTGTYKQFDIFEKTYCEFADQKQIRKSSMNNTEKLLWKIQHMSRSVVGMISSIAEICKQLGCEDEKTLRFLSQTSEKMKGLKDTITKSELPSLLTEIRDGESKKVLNLSQKLSETPAYD